MNSLTNEMMSVEYLYGTPQGKISFDRVYYRGIRPIAIILFILGLISIIRKKTSKKVKKIIGICMIIIVAILIICPIIINKIYY